MTREQFAKKIRWPVVMFWLGLLNPAALIPQAYSIVTTHVVAGISVPMFVLFMIIQLTFFMNGFFQRDKAVMVSMGASVLITTGIVFLTLYYGSIVS